MVADAPAGPFSIGVTVSGLAGGTVVLQDDGADNLSVTANGSLMFLTAKFQGAAYDVTVLTQPTSPSQSCVVANGAGTVGTANVTGITVTCTTDTFAVGGTVTGLQPGSMIELQDNGGDTLMVTAGDAGAATFTFATPVASGGAYQVSVLSADGGPMCTVSSGMGNVGDAAVTGVVVNCVVGTSTIGGVVMGLALGDSLLLKLNGGDNLFVTTNGPFTFSVPVSTGAVYDVTVLSPGAPIPESCVVTMGSGTASSNVTNVVIKCVPPCMTTVASVLSVANPYASAISVSYAMVGGGGGVGGGPNFWAAGGGGGSSAILNGPSLVAEAAGGAGGSAGGSIVPGGNGTTQTGSFMLDAGATLAVNVGGGGGGGGWDFGGGGGSGWFGGGGGGELGGTGMGGGGGSTAGGAGGGDGATSGSSQAGGVGGPVAQAGMGGSGATGGAGASVWDGGGGGGGFGGGGGACTNDFTDLPSSGGTSGANATTVVSVPGGLGATTWTPSLSLPPAAGAGGASTAGQGGNGGLVILTYTSPTQVCLF
jgi:hypothetical protein